MTSPDHLGVYALSIEPLITSLQGARKIKQCRLADDASGAGPVVEIMKWLDTLSAIGLDFGCYPNDKKCGIITKRDREISVKKAFKETAINVTVQGQRREYVEESVNNTVTTVTKPQVSYAVFTFGLKHRWAYFLRTLPDNQGFHEHKKAQYIAFSSLPSQIGSGANWTETYWHFQYVWEDWA